MKRLVAIFIALALSSIAGFAVRGTADGQCEDQAPLVGHGLALCPSRMADAANGTPTTAVQKTVNTLDSKGGVLENSTWGILAVNFKGDTLAQLNKSKRLTPASNMKLVTTAAAYLKLGRNYTFKTQIATDGAIQDSTLVGNLYIIGGGDPLIGDLFPYLPAEDVPFGKWRKVLEDNGIRRIEGNIVGDGAYFSGERRHTDWSTEDEISKDGVVPAGLTWRGKMEDSLPDGPLAAATHFHRWLQDNGIAVTGEAGYVVRQPSAGQCEDRAPLAGHGLALCPARMDAGANDIPDSLHILGTATSATLNHIATITNHQSDNFCAETLIKAIGKANNGSDDYDTATEALHRALAPIGLAGPSAKMRFADGSGLSRKNYLTPEFIVSLLRAMARTSCYKDYLNSLPRPGRKDGTLVARLPKAPAQVKNRIYMKSGSLGGVRCFSGYILPSDGDTRKTIAFSIMVNNHVGRQADLTLVLDQLILELANEN
ncbi:MAG: D-alanyl-D-alanine carboxypeptidase [Bacteroidales bacterium]|nr:D-alanyl-D-alanine carboxypeptidase [Bacteroidales bacterium]